MDSPPWLNAKLSFKLRIIDRYVNPFPDSILQNPIFLSKIYEMKTIVLLTISNIFMTFAWYGHLKYRSAPLWLAVIASWGIAFFEYCFQVPANRIGSYEFTPAQLKTIQEVITLTVFSVFSVLYLKESLKWNYIVGFGFMIVAVFFVSKSGNKRKEFQAACTFPSSLRPRMKRLQAQAPSPRRSSGSLQACERLRRP